MQRCVKSPSRGPLATALAFLICLAGRAAAQEQVIGPAPSTSRAHGTLQLAPDEDPRSHLALGSLVVPMLRRRVALVLEDPPDASADGGVRTLRDDAKRLPVQPAGLPANVPVNDPTGQVYGTGNTQMEPALAVNGDTLVCGFTDSQGFYAGGSLSGYAFSMNGGTTWTDGGSMPNAGSVPPDLVFGDPVVLTDGAGRWYYLSTYDFGDGTTGPGSGSIGVVLHHGRFVGSSMLWTGPQVVAGSIGAILDSPHMAIDPDRDRLYVTYTRILPYPQGWGQVEVVTLGSGGTSALHQVVVQVEISQQNNAGSRVAVGPDGEVHCAWESGLLGGLGQGPAQQKIARSLDLGASFAPPVVAATVIESWFSAPPGANREEFSVEYPSLAVDRSDGPDRGRVYVAWHDAVQVDFYGSLVQVSETTASNETPETAQVLPSNRHLQINGSFSTADGNDYYRFTGYAGDHVRMFLQPNAPILASVRLRCENPGGAGADTILAASSRGMSDPVFFLFTLPITGNYYVQCERRGGSGSYTGYLRRSATVLPSVAIDHRDAVIVSSPDGVSGWTPKLRVNDDSGYTDQAFPEVVVDGCGGVHVSWYDRRFDVRCRARADFMLASSFDGGATFGPNARATSVSSSWQISADAIPNFGDYFLPAADARGLYLAWADGRLGDPDVRMSPLRIDIGVQVPDTLRAIVTQPLGLEVRVDNPGAFDARFEVEIKSSCPQLADTSCTFDPLPAGADTVCTYDAIIGSWIYTAQPCTLFVEVRSSGSACVAKRRVLLLNDQVGVVLADFAATPASGAVHMQWRTERGTTFDVERADAAAGPYVRLTAEPLLADARGRCEFTDDTAGTGRRFYRLIGRAADGTLQSFGPYAVESQPPRRLVLHGGVPNPFNPSTQIRFELPRPALVTLRVHDAAGRLVAEILRHEARPAGLHAVGWDGRDLRGVPQPSGIYFAVLDVAGERRTSRLVLIR